MWNQTEETSAKNVQKCYILNTTIRVVNLEQFFGIKLIYETTVLKCKNTVNFSKNM